MTCCINFHARPLLLRWETLDHQESVHWLLTEAAECCREPSDNSKDDQKAIYRIHLDKAALDKVRYAEGFSNSALPLYTITHRIHGAGIYANIKGVYWWQMLPYIAYMDPMGHGQNMAQYQSCIAPMDTNGPRKFFKLVPKAAAVCLGTATDLYWSPQGVRDGVPRRYFWCRCHGAVRLGQGRCPWHLDAILQAVVFIQHLSPWYRTCFLDWYPGFAIQVPQSFYQRWWEVSNSNGAQRACSNTFRMMMERPIWTRS